MQSSAAMIFISTERRIEGLLAPQLTVNEAARALPARRGDDLWPVHETREREREREKETERDKARMKRVARAKGGNGR